nr:uncharacterized protein CI109_007026 [Kwoniella shandongensis]KAA5524640.1 hypothetical protein CI109_007026 [Kwoniella shandongensis]
MLEDYPRNEEVKAVYVLGNPVRNIQTQQHEGNPETLTTIASSPVLGQSDLHFWLRVEPQDGTGAGFLIEDVSEAHLMGRSQHSHWAVGAVAKGLDGQPLTVPTQSPTKVDTDEDSNRSRSEGSPSLSESEYSDY